MSLLGLFHFRCLLCNLFFTSRPIFRFFFFFCQVCLFVRGGIFIPRTRKELLSILNTWYLISRIILYFLMLINY